MVRSGGVVVSAVRVFLGRMLTTLIIGLMAPATASNAGAAGNLAPTGGQSSDVTAAIDRANTLALAKNYQAALDAYRQADNLSNHTCADCYLGMVNMECQLGDFHGALADAQRAANTAGDDRILAAQALVLRAGLLIATSGGSSDALTKEAEGEYRQALTLDPKKSIARFDLGMLLLQEGRDAEGVAEMKTYVSGPFANPRYVDRANRLIADPSRARALPSEDFSFSTIEGETISKAGLRGKVVLLDFWGTWCPPCRESVPIIADIHRKFADRAFEVVGIDSDADEQVLKSFASSNHMDWPEFLDIDGQIQELFQIQGFPTYVVLGRDGTIAFQETGLGSDTADELTTIINRELAKAYVPSSPSPVPPASSPSHTSVAVTPPNGAGTVSESAMRLPVELVYPPDDVENGDADGNIYRNEFLGLYYKFPPSLTAATEEGLDQLNRARSQEMQANGALPGDGQPGPNGSIQVPFPRILFHASPDQRRATPEVTIAVTQTTDSALDSARKDADRLKQQGMALLDAPHEIMIGKRKFVRADFTAPQDSSPLWIAMIEISVGQHYVVTFEIRASSKQEMDLLAISSQTLLISKP